MTTIYDTILRPYQQDAAARMVKERHLLLADQPGLGKTLETLAALELAGLFTKNSAQITLILSPLVNASSAWIATLERFITPINPTLEIINLAVGSSTQKQKKLSEALASESDHPIVVVANHNALDVTKKAARIPALFDTYYGAVVIDESHMVLPIVTPGKITNFWRGLSKIQYSSSDALRIAVSGTPDRGKPEYRYGTWLFIKPNIVGKHWDWLTEHFNIFEQKVSRHRTIRKIGSIKKPADWVLIDRQYVIRRTKEEVLPELPPKMYNFIELGLTPEHRKAYEARELQARFDYAQEKKASSLLVFSTVARQMATYHEGSSTKLDWLLEWLDSRPTGKVVISSQFVKTLEWFKIKLDEHGYNVGLLTGSMSANARNLIQARFQDRNDDLRIVLLSGSMGVGIDLDVADDLIMLDLPYDPDKLEQIEDRVHRASNMHQVSIWHLLTKDSIDMAIAEVSTTRRFETRKLLDGSRGVDFSRKVVKAITEGDDDGND